MKLNDEKQLLEKMGLELSVPDTGCCGMAGAFGFEQGDHYDVSIRCGERVLLPAVRQESKDTLIIADGFSCREQVKQQTGRVPLHLAQVIQMAQQEGLQGAAGDYPEQRYIHAPTPVREKVKTAAIVGAGAFALGAGIWWAVGKMRRPGNGE